MLPERKRTAWRTCDGATYVRDDAGRLRRVERYWVAFRLFWSTWGVADAIEFRGPDARGRAERYAAVFNGAG